MYNDMYDPSQRRTSSRKMRAPPAQPRGGAMMYGNQYDDYNDYQEMDDNYYVDNINQNANYSQYDDRHGDQYDDGYYEQRDLENDDDDDNNYHHQPSRQQQQHTRTMLQSRSSSKSRDAISKVPSKISSVSSAGLKTADAAFQMTAKFAVDYLSPKVEQGATSYYLDLADTMFLDAVIPQDIRPDFVEAVAYRASLNVSSGNNNAELKSIVEECDRLGLGQKDCFLVGGGQRIDDGRIFYQIQKEKSNTKRNRKSGAKADSRLENIVGSKLNTSDEAFEVTAKLVVDYLASKLEPGAKSYHLNIADTIFLDAVVPKEIRAEFVQAVAYRASNISPGHQCTPLESLVQECDKLGLGHEKSFLLGGGMKMDDGRILVLTGAGLGTKKKKRKKKKTKQEPTMTLEQNNETDMSWLENSGLPADQMELIKSAMIEGNVGQKVKQGRTSINEKEQKFRMDSNRRKRTSNIEPGLSPSQSMGLVSANNPFSQTSKKNQQSKAPLLPRGVHARDDSLSSMNRDKDKIVEVIGGPKKILKKDSMTPEARAERASQRRMRSVERRSKITLYEAEVEAPLQTTWRDDIWDFTNHGVCHKFFILSLLTPMIALGQIQTREKLNWRGLPAQSDEEVASIFYNIATLTVVYLALNAGLAYGIYWFWLQGIVNTICIFLLIMVNVGFSVRSIVICGNTRWSIRKRNNIPQIFELSDYVLSLVYLRLVVAQLGRHTADYGKTNAAIFSGTGLSSKNAIPDYMQPQKPHKISQHQGAVMV